MNDEQKPGESSEPRQTPPPVEPIPLNYGLSRYPRKKQGLHISLQITLGAGLWLAAVGLFAAVMQMLDDTNVALGIVAPVEFISVLVLGLWLRSKYDWRGIVPGLLIGIGLTCLVPVGIAVVLCGHWH
jgi:hypothetical protein